MEKLICVGKNYLAHAKELGDAVPGEPVYFFKPPSSLKAIQDGDQVEWPAAGGALHHEVELVLRIARTPTGWTFSHFTVGLDMTLRDRQATLKKAGLSWEKAKVFRHAAVIAPLSPLDGAGALARVLELPLQLKINGEVRQSGSPRDMRWSPGAILDDLPRHFPLVDGDLLFTGTPEGVGPINDGDRLELILGSRRTQMTARRTE